MKICPIHGRRLKHQHDCALCEIRKHAEFFSYRQPVAKREAASVTPQKQK